jgi:hypothetical protein
MKVTEVFIRTNGGIVRNISEKHHKHHRNRHLKLELHIHIHQNNADQNNANQGDLGTQGYDDSNNDIHWVYEGVHNDPRIGKNVYHGDNDEHSKRGQKRIN